MSDISAESYPLLTDAIATGAGEAFALGSDNKAFQVKGSTSSGTGAATILIEVSNDTTWPWLTLVAIPLTLGVVEVTDGAVMSSGWKFCRARVSVISGTGAKVSANVGI